MITLSRRYIILCFICIAIFLLLSHTLDLSLSGRSSRTLKHHSFKWSKVQQRYPVDRIRSLPNGPPQQIPQIQYRFPKETKEQRSLRQGRLAAVKESFEHSWKGYKSHAWLQDEVAPLSGKSKNGYGGWGATLVDSLDTLWIMGMKKDFNAAVSALNKIDLSTSPLLKINVFETNIRYLGGLLSAYDVSGGKYKALLRKAVELGEMLYVAFDTPNRMPVNHWDWENAANDGPQDTPSHVSLAEYGSFILEFTRLSQLTGDSKYFDAAQRIMDHLDKQQNQTKLPGLWPTMLRAQSLDFTMDTTFTLGASADSVYEYLVKMHILTSGRLEQYQRMYDYALSVARERLFFRPMTEDNQEILISGTIHRISSTNMPLQAEGSHLTCFVGGMVGLGAKTFSNDSDLLIARRLTDGCIWAANAMPSGIHPELFMTKPCLSYDDCEWSKDSWYDRIRHDDTDATLEARRLPVEQRVEAVIKRQHLVPGFTRIKDARYMLRPEAIESVFVMYRISGDRALQDRAWDMFQAINKHARTKIAYASVEDVTVADSQTSDTMESFWTAETLKYFYLIFSEPDLVSLDDYVFNTEAHPFRRPTI